jgi:hypothetical protein
MDHRDAAPDGADAGACVGPSIPGNPACEGCQNDKCCVTASNCAADGECAALEQCLAGDGGTGCAAQHPKGVWDQSGLDVCRQNQCVSVCGASAPMCGGIIPDPSSCKDAVYAACCAQTAACGASDACLAFVYQCLDKNGCGPSGACYQACRAMYPEALPVFDAMAACWNTVSC